MQFVSNELLDRMCKVLGREIKYEKSSKTLNDLLNLIDRQHEEIEQYKSQEAYLLERIKRLERHKPVAKKAPYDDPND